MTTPNTRAPAEAHAPTGNPWHTLVAVAFGVMMVGLDGTIVAVANPAIGAGLGASMDQLQWVLHGYLLGLAAFLVTAGRLGDRFGHRRTYTVGLVGFVATSVVIALAPTVAALVALRVLQGIFGALLIPAAMGLLRTSFPPEKLGRAFGAASALISTATAAGPFVGGVLVDTFGWEAVFLVNLPVGILAFALGLRLLPPNRATDSSTRTDPLGIVLIGLSMFGLVRALVEGPHRGWADPAAALPLGGALLAGAVFVWWQRSTDHPLLPLELFANRTLSIGAVLMICMAIGLMGTLFYATFYLQDVRGLAPAQAGLVLLPMTAMMAVTSPLAGRVLDRASLAAPTVLGLLAAAAGVFLLSRLEQDTAVLSMTGAFALLGAGLGAVMTGATAAIVGSAPVRLAGVASALQQAAMQLGGSLGTALLGAMMAADAVSGTDPAVFMDGLGRAFTLAAAVLLAAAVPALFLRRRTPVDQVV
ncbi:MFS transporter [Nocardiopsis sp. HNM0947]|uniref:MFS transporter n=1 Tax=Nocardiopsis coralli TaxID=2772213 RepID=A0ABR9PF00_9ACTN|nr:MFS transporter [Nocardiopsis coralli]MBE3002407.1 MFS transporter [Nocardiopsis coralli]